MKRCYKNFTLIVMIAFWGLITSCNNNSKNELIKGKWDLILNGNKEVKPGTVINDFKPTGNNIGDLNMDIKIFGMTKSYSITYSFDGDKFITVNDTITTTLYISELSATSFKYFDPKTGLKSEMVKLEAK